MYCFLKHVRVKFQVVVEWHLLGLTFGLIGLLLEKFVLNYLLGAGITIIEIFAVMLFFVLLMALSVSVYSKEMMQLGQKMLKDKKMIKKSWLAILVWIILILWAVKELIA